MRRCRLCGWIPLKSRVKTIDCSKLEHDCAGTGLNGQKFAAELSRSSGFCFCERPRILLAAIKMSSPATSPGPRTPNASHSAFFTSTSPRSSEKKPSRQRPRLRNLNLTKLFPLVRARSSPAEGAAPFTPVHAPDRPERLTPASAAPSEQECRDFFMAFRSPKKLGFLDDENEGEDQRFSGIDMSLWRPWLVSNNTTTPTSPVGDAEREARRQPLSPLTALSESPLLQEAVAVRQTDSVAARLIDVDNRAKTPPSEVVTEEAPAQSPVEDYRPRQGSFFTTLQEARTRSSLLASHRMAARGSIEARDSGYKSWRGSEQQQKPGDRLSMSRTSTSSGFSRHSNIRPGGLGHVAHQVARRDSAPLPPPSEPLSVKSSFAGTRISAVAGSPGGSTPTSLQCQYGDANDRGAESDIYGDWAEYYFESDNFAPSTSDSVSTMTARQAGGGGSRASTPDRDDISPKTSWYEPNDTEEVEGPRKMVCPVQRAINKGRREAFTYRTTRELMEVPGYRFEHESYGEAAARQECALGSVWTRSGGRWEEATGLL
ncbi:hypothetical protein F5X68DRAFT_15116 [Plectosphaerella plurivora]|uniref:Uncharacterized protein n=1 Tax=Plectosphaerella plurivora TaxID=936078 RepID=A0A9P8VBK6_9PEZI|nr:hypothetical protein F5X68DRAFT_15116 [Plectosphaerella plurivora]